VRGDRAAARLLKVDDAVAAHHVLGPVRELLDDPALEPGQEPGVGADHALPVEVKPYLGGQRVVGLIAVADALDILGLQVPLIDPFVERLAPVAEVDEGQALLGLVAKNGQCALAIRHGDTSFWTMDDGPWTTDLRRLAA